MGNGIAHIQDLGRILKNAGCYVCILKTPILWEQDIIKVLVMIKTKRDGDKNLSLLYDVFCGDIKSECLNICFHSII